MQDPLTQAEHDQFFDNVRAEYDRRYKSALVSGALSEDDVTAGSHILAKCVLQIAAGSFRPLDSRSKAFLKNLEMFV